ncbi:MAG TPA: hypothetical protein VM328_02355 [Fimbriimonadaceae bacterium]|nr:hypothetical protein [Fimbriimonadaceae bacterium]
MSAFAAAFLLCAVPFRQERAPEPLFPRIIGVATGRNGYEEYISAVDLIQEPRLARLIEDHLQRSPGQDWLASHERLSASIRPVLELIRAGNAKPAFDPRPITVETVMPQLSHFKTLTRLIAAESYLRLSQGDAAGATSAFLDGLTFSHRISQKAAISNLVSIACISIMLAQLEHRAGTIDRASASRIISWCDKFLATPNPLMACLESERQVYAALIEQLFSSPKRFLAELRETDPQGAEKYVSEIAGMSDAERRQRKAQMFERMNERMQLLVRVLREPENRWVPPISREVEVFGIEPILEGREMIGDAQHLQASAKSRTQIRLLRLHASIALFRWEYARLPSDLAELRQTEYAYDPLSSGPFLYRPLPEMAYELYSQGNSHTGPVHLKMRRTPEGRLDEQDFRPPG